MQTIPAGTAISAPNNSMAKTAQAIGVLDAAPKTAAKQAAAARTGDRCRGPESAEPSVAPITKSGVTSPPGI